MIPLCACVLYDDQKRTDGGGGGAGYRKRSER